MGYRRHSRCDRQLPAGFRSRDRMLLHFRRRDLDCRPAQDQTCPRAHTESVTSGPILTVRITSRRALLRMLDKSAAPKRSQSYFLARFCLVSFPTDFVSSAICRQERRSRYLRVPSAMASCSQRARMEPSVFAQILVSSCFASVSSRTQSATLWDSGSRMILSSADLCLHSFSTLSSGRRPAIAVVNWDPMTASVNKAALICASSSAAELTAILKRRNSTVERGVPKNLGRDRQIQVRRPARAHALEHDPEKCEAVFRKDHAQSRI